MNKDFYEETIFKASVVGDELKLLGGEAIESDDAALDRARELDEQTERLVEIKLALLGRAINPSGPGNAGSRATFGQRRPH